MGKQKSYISRDGIMVGYRPQLSKGFKKIGFSEYPLDIHITATEDQLKYGRLTITVNRIINNELYETVIPNAKVDEFPIQFIDEWDDENESLDFIKAQEEIAMQRARENAVDSVRKIRELKATSRRYQKQC